MAKWVHADVLDNGPNHIKTNCTRLLLIDSYSSGDSYATVTAAILAEVAMADADFTNGDGASGARTLTSASGKQDANANATGTGAGNHFAFVDDDNDKVLWVTTETSGQDILSTSNAVNFPSLVYTVNQPT